LFTLSEWLEAIGNLWINALRMIVVPLIVAYIVTAVASFSQLTSTFKIGGNAVLTHLLLIGSGMAVMTLLSPSVVSIFEVTPEMTAALQDQVLNTPLANQNVNTDISVTDAISYIIPDNLFRAAAEENILPIFVASLLFALALTKVSEPNRKKIVGFFDALIETLHVLIGWIISVMPFAIFALVFAMATESGADLLSALLFFVVAYCALTVLLILFLYIITPLFGNVSLKKFAEAMLPAQTVAVGTRSSLVCLPALIEGARDKLKLPEKIVGIIMPMSVSIFKINKAVSAPLQLYFLAHIYGIELEPIPVLLFMLAYIPTSFTSPGIPSTGLFITLPLYLAMGIPIEGYVILKTVDAIPDIFKTVVNVTEDMSVAVLVARFSGQRSPAHETALNT
ncbi:MAG: cation:dicarboxylase symporter family transporter, partial [Balneolaceae bacterium]|nr:cation:dicarboxylase symporter family transporter [Balneolaceae bacterium]